MFEITLVLVHSVFYIYIAWLKKSQDVKKKW